MSWRLVVAGALLLALVVWSAGWCASPSPRGVEAERLSALHGHWITDAPLYADRSLRITDDEIAFGTGQDAVERYPIESVLVDGESDEGTLYTVAYRLPDDAVSEMTLLLREDRLRIEHREGILWHRKESDDASP